jgi:nicotinate-nucleotide adenylyltransferase
MRRFAIFGGTFDPIHIGHMRGLVEVREIIDFEKIFLVPAGVPPHKNHLKRSPPEDRLKMARLAAKDLGTGIVSTFEIESKEPSFTFNTLSHFSSALENMSPTLIIGSDSLLEINTWHRYEDVLSQAHLAILPRPGFLMEENLDELGKKLWPVRIKEIKRNYPSSASDSLTTDRDREIALLKMSRLDISSTEIRQKVKAGKSIKFLVTQSVEKYIIEKRLYLEV